MIQHGHKIDTSQHEWMQIWYKLTHTRGVDIPEGTVDNHTITDGNVFSSSLFIVKRLGGKGKVGGAGVWKGPVPN